MRCTMYLCPDTRAEQDLLPGIGSAGTAHTSISIASVGVHAGVLLRREKTHLSANIIRKHIVAYVLLNG